MVIPEKAAPVTGTTSMVLLTLCLRTLGSERHRYAIEGPDKFGTALMAVGSTYKYAPPWKTGGLS